ncbi:alpha/beta hydrolase [Patescibacteria group bacterium]|nr:alpha/beta hydrolase [Patescibacteria group bacterium]MCG2701967.1 alpha/beta hydrolase [Candidatus Parcubacteria bacterium]MBU4265031.1 alpha/beta hydrolase [Patescibacteria group bacterium]MBU4390184.1 alpha/beta hydrolase [Patescibacteria group bacterium]MBU4397452.1 alpha/beta hydrolase [Patescibacteria group bacterium]
MKKFVGIFVVILVTMGMGCFLYWNSVGIISPKETRQQPRQLGGLERYDFDSLRTRYVNEEFGSGDFEILDGIEAVELRRKNLGYRTREFGFETRQIRYKSEDKWITGMINYPEGCFVTEGILRCTQDDVAIIIMIRGYADKEGYYSGFGSWRVADELTKAGFVTISLDFLGYGGSDSESLDMMEARFEKVIGVLDLVGVVRKLDFVDKEKIGIWAHSNGGQIAMSILEITGAFYPTVLWAPMTNPFPKSILDTASELADGGEVVVLALREFEGKYDARRYAIENYYSWINGPIVIHQGSADVWCKVEWQEDLQSRLRELGKDVELRVYEGDDHNLSKNWGRVVKLDIEFFKKNLFVN